MGSGLGDLSLATPVQQIETIEFYDIFTEDKVLIGDEF